MNKDKIFLKAKQILLKDNTDNLDKLIELATFLNQELPYYNWFGYYFVVKKDKNLILGPFKGENTEHIKISYDEKNKNIGMCGEAVIKAKTLKSGDVTKLKNYIACSLKVKSEIVVPIFRDGEVVAEIDIDSFKADAFDDNDVELLEKLAKLLSPLIPNL